MRCDAALQSLHLFLGLDVAESLGELLEVWELGRLDEVHERPEFVSVILNSAGGGGGVLA